MKSMNAFTDVLKANISEIVDTETLPGLVLTVQRLLVQNELTELPAARQLVNSLLSSPSHNDAVQLVFKYAA